MKMSNTRSEPFLSLESKVGIAGIVLKEVFTKNVRPLILWNADRDTTVALHLVKATVENMELRMPPAVFVDHGDHFPETLDMVQKVSKDLNFRLITVRNEDVLDNVKDGKIAVSSLNDDNRSVLEKANIRDEDLSLSNDEVFRELLVKAPIEKAIARHRFDSVITAPTSDFPGGEGLNALIGRMNEETYSVVNPTLMFTGADLWKYTFDNSIPVHPKYREGHTSVFRKENNTPGSDKPAWEDEMIKEDASRDTAEDRERMMEKLRALGYI